jgi:hypothetical protein
MAKPAASKGANTSDRLHVTVGSFMKVPYFGPSIVGALVAVLIAWQASDARTWILLTRPNGSLTSGSFMGASVGEPADTAVADLTHAGFGHVEYFPGGGSLYQGGVMRIHENEVVTILPRQTVIANKEDSWRHGAIELIEDRGKVVRITWGFGGPLAYFNF